MTHAKDKSEYRTQTKVHLPLCEIRVEHLIWRSHRRAEGIFRTAVRSFVMEKYGNMFNFISQNGYFHGKSGLTVGDLSPPKS